RRGAAFRATRESGGSCGSKRVRMRFEVMTAALMTAEQGLPGVPGAARLDTGKPAFWHHRHAAVAIGRLGPSARPGVARGEVQHQERWSPSRRPPGACAGAMAGELSRGG